MSIVSQNFLSLVISETGDADMNVDTKAITLIVSGLQDEPINE
jgi:hypothetical protein